MERAKGREASGEGEGAGKGRVGRREGGREEEKGGNESATDPQTRSGRSRPAPDQQLCPHGNSNTAVSIAPPRLLPALAPATPNGPSRSLPCADRPHSHVRGFPRLSVVPVAPGKTPPQVTLGRSAFPPPPRRSRKRPEQSFPAAPPCFLPATGFGRSSSQAGRERRRESCRTERAIAGLISQRRTAWHGPGLPHCAS